VRPIIWITLVRGLWSIALDLALLLPAYQPKDAFLNFMAIYWLGSSIVTIRWSRSGVRVRRVSLAIGVVGVVAGAVALGHALRHEAIGHAAVLSVLGAVIVVTGVFHIADRFLGTNQAKRAWVGAGIALGTFEIILGVIVVRAPYTRSTAVIVAASSWAILGGVLLLLDALRMRQAVHLT
jgi:uncharacterized membrane protein HdeD (DUF308 family)